MTMETNLETQATVGRVRNLWALDWSPIVVGALAAAATSSIMIAFGATLGLGVASAAPTWRDASASLSVLSGLFLILQALISFGCGGYLAGRLRSPYRASESDDVEQWDGFHGLAAWALAVVLGILLTAAVTGAASRRSALTAPPSATEPSVLSYEIDTLFRAARRPPNADLTPARAEAGRILLTSSSHSGVSPEDRAYLVQMVGATTGLTGADAERRVDSTVSASKSAISRARASTIIIAFSVAAALLFGAIAAWAGAEAGGRHRDGMPLESWMLHANRFNRAKTDWRRTPATLPE
ncbi:hypothetical protein JQ615_00160 [Bradyrhizobium jicamae]|uniref:Uncharacterized protein n=1 Tax=Bradyrhizobium jicamae TaxID=280332 RepID=A0ABS5FAI7_9BRAD|nr:hypothetical protein [Bradyrhizobium jicamae]MBR0793799.1 hypothetical protein [Bradyrhizobium jicamae]MBR0933428.1 hypothetical protein [Bradyrhizobium jicamae]